MRSKKTMRHIEKNSKMTEVSPPLSVTNLIVEYPIKSQILAEWIKNYMIQLYAVYKRINLDPKTQIG